MKWRAVQFGLVAVIALASIGLAKRAEAETRTVPDVSPMYVHDSEPRLQRAGFKASISSVPPITRADGNVNGYVVVDQSPQAGSRAPVGSTVRLTVAMSINAGSGGLGAEGRITVPKLVGRDVNRAIWVATTHGLFVNVAPVDHEVERLVVTRQSEPPGSMVDAGSEITRALS